MHYVKLNELVIDCTFSGSVKLRTLSKSWGKISGGDAMHVIGAPFIQGPSLG